MKHYFKLYAGVLFAIIFFIKCKEKQKDNPQTYSFDERKTSIIKLIANPVLYDKKTIQLKGFINIEFENSAIYLHREDFENGMDKNGIWLQISKMDLSKFSKLNGNYVRLEGIFDKNNNGHNGSFSGAISRIIKIEALNKPAIRDVPSVISN